MKLNKFFALKTNFITELGDEDDLGGGSGSGSGPVTLTQEEVSAQLDIFNKAIDKKFPAFTDAQKDAYKAQAYANFLVQMGKDPSIKIPMENFAGAVGLTPAEATAQYTNFVFDDDIAEAIDGIGSYTGIIRAAQRDYDPTSDAAMAAEGMKSVFSTDGQASFTPTALTVDDIQVATDYEAPTPDQLATRLDAFLPRDRQVARITQNTPAYTVADTLDTSMFDAINFPERTINRGVPVVTKGIDAQGNPTTAITMGTAAASPSGPTIGELDISAILPSTGMGINADGTGTTTVGTQGTTGNIVASSADTLNMVNPGVAANAISTIDPNVLGTQGNTVTAGPITRVTPPTPPTPTPTPAKTQAQIIQDLFNSSPTKDVAAIRIGDYAASVGGITAQQIADAVQPIVGGRPDFGIDPFEAGTGGDEVLKAVADGGYGGGFITETAEDISAAQPMYNTLAAKQNQFRYGFGDDKAVGDADYTPQEAAYRMLDFAQRNNMTLDQAAQSFDLTEADARKRAGELDIDLAQFGFADGGEVEDSRSKAVGSRLMAQAGIGSMQGQSMSPEMAGTIDRIMARRK